MCLIQKQLNAFCFVSHCCCCFKGHIWALIGHLDHCFTISKGETKAAVYCRVILALAIFTMVPKIRLCPYIVFVPQSLQLL